jgi:hypothetical protein
MAKVVDMDAHDVAGAIFRHLYNMALDRVGSSRRLVIGAGTSDFANV